jgi:hypothetical protein
MGFSLNPNEHKKLGVGKSANRIDRPLLNLVD